MPPSFRVSGGRPLKGTIRPAGNKNAALPILAATLLADGPCRIDNVPHIRDVETMLELLAHLGAAVAWTAPNSVEVNTAAAEPRELDPKLSARIRASILLAGPMLARFGRVNLPDRKSTRLNSSHSQISYAVFCLKKKVDALTTFDPLTGKSLRKHDKIAVYPKSHFVAPRDRTNKAVTTIKEELVQRRGILEKEGRLLEAQRLHQRTMFDLEMIREIGYCHGIENYARHLTGRAPGEPPPTLLDYLPKDALIVVDESHQTVPQIRGMYHGDRSRKEVLVAYGFRLPSALDNRPLNFQEWEERVGQVTFVSATPGPYELAKSQGVVVEQIIRPTGLIDPPIEVRPVKGQVDNLLAEIRERVARKERVLVTTLTKRMSEDLTQYYQELGVRVPYLHSDIETLERVQILRDLRRGEFDVLVGINLLREGLDLPEVSLVAILDADKE